MANKCGGQVVVYVVFETHHELQQEVGLGTKRVDQKHLQLGHERDVVDEGPYEQDGGVEGQVAGILLGHEYHFPHVLIFFVGLKTP